MYGVAKGFVLGAGDPRKAKYAFVLEAPGREEVGFGIRPIAGRAFLSTQAECDVELAIRRRDYPGMEERFLRTGLPVVSQTGAAMQFWLWPKVGIRREDSFLDNTLRCLAPVSRAGAAYPTGAARKQAELHCRQYDRLESFRPDTIVTTIHPASVLREITPLPLVIKDFEKVRDFTAQGRKVLMLLGGKAAHGFLRYAENSTKWRGTYSLLDSSWPDTYKSKFEFKAKGRKKAERLSENERAERDFFGVPESVRTRAKEKRKRPEETNSVACKSAKRYKGKRPPKCSCAPCWDKYEHKEPV